MRYSIMFLAIVASICLAAGCGGGDKEETAPVRGKVMVDGKPLTMGAVVFIPETPGPTATGEIQEDGTFSMKTYEDGDGAVIGKHGVMISAIEEPPPDALPENPVAPKLLVAARYNSVQTSGITIDVPSDGKEDVVFEVTKK